jgi:pimeloyl-ACP methyl ester carboxylesterase
VIQGAGHFVQRERPEVVLEEILTLTGPAEVGA